MDNENYIHVENISKQTWQVANRGNIGSVGSSVESMDTKTLEAVIGPNLTAKENQRRILQPALL